MPWLKVISDLLASGWLDRLSFFLISLKRVNLTRIIAEIIPKELKRAELLFVFFNQNVTIN